MITLASVVVVIVAGANAPSQSACAEPSQAQIVGEIVSEKVAHYWRLETEGETRNERIDACADRRYWEALAIHHMRHPETRGKALPWKEVMSPSELVVVMGECKNTP
jgi:hypothetical protein